MISIIIIVLINIMMHWLCRYGVTSVVSQNCVEVLILKICTQFAHKTSIIWDYALLFGSLG